MAKFCRKCGNPIGDGMKFCTKCGTAVIDNKKITTGDKTPEIKQQKPVNIMPSPPVSPVVPRIEANTAGQAPKKEEKKKSKGKKILCICLVLIIILLIISGGVYVYFKKFAYQGGSGKEEFEQNISKLSKKPVIEMYYDDYNNDGNQEAYALVGTDSDTASSYRNAELWYADDNETTNIEKEISGHSNGIIKNGNLKYLSLESDKKSTESNISDTTTGGETTTVSTTNIESVKTVSYIYGVQDNKSYEPDISGKYSNVHQDGEKIIGQDEQGKQVEIQEGNETWEVKQITTTTTHAAAKALTKDEVATFENMFSNFFYCVPHEYINDGCNIDNYVMQKIPKEKLYLCIIGDLYSMYSAYFDDEYIERCDNKNAVKDPRNKLADNNEDLLSNENKWQIYRRRKVSNVEWILKNVLNTEPDRNNYKEGFVHKDNIDYYLEGDYYYTETGAYGDGCPSFKLKDYEVTSDGKYKLIMNDDYSTLSYTVIAELKNVDGREFLALISATSNDSKSSGNSSTTSNVQNSVQGTTIPNGSQIINIK